MSVDSNEENIFHALEKWYLEQCDGEWEHEFGIEIENIDNPGWQVSIPLTRTRLQFEPFESIKIDRSEDDWVHCVKIDERFQGYGGPLNLQEILAVFISWQSSIN